MQRWNTQIKGRVNKLHVHSNNKLMEIATSMMFEGAENVSRASKDDKHVKMTMKRHDI